jgi:hypothetical protein
MMLAIGFGAASLGKRFRLYSVVTIAILVVFGTLTGIGAPRLEANLPTPWLGVWERICIASGMIWIAVLAIPLLRLETPAAARGRQDTLAASKATWRGAPVAEHPIRFLVYREFSTRNVRFPADWPLRNTSTL